MYETMYETGNETMCDCQSVCLGVRAAGGEIRTSYLEEERKREISKAGLRIFGFSGVVSEVRTIFEELYF